MSQAFSSQSGLRMQEMTPQHVTSTQAQSYPSGPQWVRGTDGRNYLATSKGYLLVDEVVTFREQLLYKSAGTFYHLDQEGNPVQFVMESRAAVQNAMPHIPQLPVSQSQPNNQIISPPSSTQAFQLQPTTTQKIAETLKRPAWATTSSSKTLKSPYGQATTSQIKPVGINTAATKCMLEAPCEFTQILAAARKAAQNQA